ncbi:MAG: hypothetical protein LBM93_13900 [Oscillospiraceae bacterium]|jgi:hypothetical protein|nr:hypothetical protein [Oscillospiraceae bacterium]
MKFKKVLSWLTATIMMLSATAVVASAEGEDTTGTGDTPSASDSATTQVTVGGGVYEISLGRALLVDVADPGATSFTLYGSVKADGVDYEVSGIDVSAFDETDIKSFRVRSSDIFRAVDGVLYHFVKVDKDGKEGSGDDYKFFKDTLVAYPPQGAKTFTLPLSVASIADAAFSVAPSPLVVSVPKNHTNLATNTAGDLVEFETVDGESKFENGVIVTPKVTKILGTIISKSDDIKFVASGTSTPSDTTNTPSTTNPDTDAAPQTGAAGAGVALAALLATGSTAVVLRKRGRK